MRITMVVSVVALTGFAIAMTSDEPRTRAARAPKSGSSLMDKISLAKSGTDAGKAFRQMFAQCDANRLRELKANTNIGIALQSAWEEGRVQIRKKDEVLHPRFVQRFLGFV